VSRGKNKAFQTVTRQANLLHCVNWCVSHNSFIASYKTSAFNAITKVDMNDFNYSANSMKAVCIFSTFDKYAAVDFFFTVLSIVINLLTCPLVILLNALLMTAMGKIRRLQTMHNILLASIAGTDLAVGIVSQPICIALVASYLSCKG